MIDEWGKIGDEWRNPPAHQKGRERRSPLNPPRGGLVTLPKIIFVEQKKLFAMLFHKTPFIAQTCAYPNTKTNVCVLPLGR